MIIVVWVLWIARVALILRWSWVSVLTLWHWVEWTLTNWPALPIIESYNQRRKVIFFLKVVSYYEYGKVGIKKHWRTIDMDLIWVPFKTKKITPKVSGVPSSINPIFHKSSFTTEVSLSCDDWEGWYFYPPSCFPGQSVNVSSVSKVTEYIYRVTIFCCGRNRNCA